MAKARRTFPDTSGTRARDIADRYIGIRVPAALDARLTAIAKREGNGISAVCRRLLSKALAAEAA